MQNLLGNNGSAMPGNVNPFDYPSEVCECGCEIFVPGVIFKKIPGVLAGAGAQEMQFPVKIFYCSKCGKISPYDNEMMEKAKQMKAQIESANNKSNLIL